MGSPGALRSRIGEAKEIDPADEFEVKKAPAGAGAIWR